MAGTGRRYTFHGAFGSSEKAYAKERKTKGSFVRRVRMGRGRGKKKITRWVVMRERLRA